MKAKKIARIVKRILLALFMLSVIALAIIIYAIPSVTEVLTPTEVLEYGSFRVSEEVTVYFVRNERVYMATRAGTINYYVGDGVHVKAGTRILHIVAGAQTPHDAHDFEGAQIMYEANEFVEIVDRLGHDAVFPSYFVSEFNGIVSYHIDGFENYFTPDNMRYLRYDSVSRLDLTPTNVVRYTTRVGDPLYKIADNREWFMVAWVGTGNVARYERGRNVTIELPAGDVRATVQDIIEDGDRWLIIFRTNRYYADFARIRYAPATIVTSNFHGIMIGNESIVVNDGVIGVYVRTRAGNFVFRPIQIITSYGDSSLVEVSVFYDEEGNRIPTVNLHDEILRRPDVDTGESE